MKTFEVGLKEAVLGLPFYVTWNMAAYIREQQGLADIAKATFATKVLVPVATALWVAPWLVALWVVSRLMGMDW